MSSEFCLKRDANFSDFEFPGLHSMLLFEYVLLPTAGWRQKILNMKRQSQTGVTTTEIGDGKRQG